MPLYKQANSAGTQWQRCFGVFIENPLDGVPSISFSEEQVASVGGASFRQTVPGCKKSFTPGGTFPLLDPSTNLPMGVTMTHAELYTALYSLYMQTAAERDAAA